MPRLAGFRLLIVEDDVHAAEILQTALDVAEFPSEVAESGTDAFNLIMTSIQSGYPYDMVVCDVMIPGINGLDLMKKVKEANTTIGFVLVSAYEDENLSLQKQAELEGALAFFSKPYDYKELIRFIAQYKEGQ